MAQRDRDRAHACRCGSAAGDAEVSFVRVHRSARAAPLFEAARKRGLRIFWLPVSAWAYEATEIAGFTALHDPRTRLDQIAPAERNAALVEVYRQIDGALKRG